MEFNRQLFKNLKLYFIKLKIASRLHQVTVLMSVNDSFIQQDLFKMADSFKSS